MAAKSALSLEKFNLTPDKRLGEGRIFVRSIESSSDSLSLPYHSVLLVDIHYGNNYTIEKIKKEIQECIYTAIKDELITGANFRCALQKRQTPYLAPYFFDPENSEVSKFRDAYKSVYNKPPDMRYGKTVADENLLALKNIPVITWGPIGGGSHSREEWVSKKSVINLANNYVKVLQRYIFSKARNTAKPGQGI